MRALINATTYDFEYFRENQYVLFDTKILETGCMEDFKGAEEIHDCKGCVVMPGLVNCHTHVYSTFSRGMQVPFNPLNFKDILDQLWWKLDRQLDNTSVYYSGLVYGIDCIRNGVTSIIDHHASGFDIRGTLNSLKKSMCDELGLRGIFCFETSDRFSLSECIEENLEFLGNSSPMHAGLFGMHASMSLGRESLNELSRVIGEHPIHIHVSESIDDVNDSISKYGKRVVERLEEHGILNSNSILSHCVHISDREADIIAKKNCYVAMNPTSNMNNAVGLGDYRLMRDRNIKCLIGNDGLGSNITRDYMNMVFSMKNRLGSPTAFGLGDLTDMIGNGYEYINKMLNINAGRIKEGYEADMIVIPYIPPTPMDEGNAMAHVFYGIFDNLHPREVWVAGRQLLKDYKPAFDDERILSEARQQAIGVWERINKG